MKLCASIFPSFSSVKLVTPLWNPAAIKPLSQRRSTGYNDLVCCCRCFFSFCLRLIKYAFLLLVWLSVGIVYFSDHVILGVCELNLFCVTAWKLSTKICCTASFESLGQTNSSCTGSTGIPCCAHLSIASSMMLLSSSCKSPHKPLLWRQGAWTESHQCTLQGVTGNLYRTFTIY